VITADIALACLDRNVLAALRCFGSRGDGAALREVGPALVVTDRAGCAGAFHNAALRRDRSGPADAVLAAARTAAAESGRDLVLWVSEHGDADLERLARAAGLVERPAVVGMAVDRAPEVPTRPGVLVREVVDGVGVTAFGSVHRELSGDAVGQFGSAGVLLGSDVTGLVVQADGRPVAAALVVGSGAEAGIYWVATKPGARRRGFGALVTAAAVRAGFRGGAGIVVLQATAAGAGLYRRLGFVDCTRYRRFVVPAG
jgi:ribosomal protein S18 acetylase RimI-like enzyme